MKGLKCVLVLNLVLINLWALGQQYPQYTMYMANNFVLNPALAGIEPYVDMKLAVRSQWIGINDAPQTIYATVNSPWSISNFRNNKIGLGGKVFMDKAGPIILGVAEVSFAYHLPLTNTMKLSLGTGLGVNHQRVNIAELDLGYDPLLEGDFNATRPNINAGFWLYSKDFYTGFSVQNLLNANELFTAAGGLRMPLQPHYFATAAYRFKTGDFYITPSVMTKFVNPVPVSYDANIKAQFSDVFWLGASYRHREGIAAMAGFFVSSSLNVAYSYDFGSTNIRRYTRGSHEIMIGINLDNQWGPKCPTVIW